jgi:hypothetical protein
VPGLVPLPVGIIENRSAAGQPHNPRRLLKTTASLACSFALSGFLVERNLPDEPNQQNKPNKPDQPAGSCSHSAKAA